MSIRAEYNAMTTSGPGSAQVFPVRGNTHVIISALCLVVLAIVSGCASTSTPRAVPTPTPGSGGVPGGIVRWMYTSAGAPKEGYSQVDFTEEVNRDPGHSSYFWAQSGQFAGDLQNSFYIGIQPWGDAFNGSLQREVLFSVFGSGASSTSATCEPGADSGAGESCRIPYSWTANVRYELAVDRTSSSVWTGTITDTATGKSAVIGTISIPASWGNIAPSSLGGFTEYFSSVPSCSALPRAEETNFPAAIPGLNLTEAIDDTYTYGSSSRIGHINCSAYATSESLPGGMEVNSLPQHPQV